MFSVKVLKTDLRVFLGNGLRAIIYAWDRSYSQGQLDSGSVRELKMLDKLLKLDNQTPTNIYIYIYIYMLDVIMRKLGS